MNIKKQIQFLLAIASVVMITTQGCHSVSNSNDEYYGLNDFKSVKKIDSHTHVMSTKHAMMEQAMADNFTLISLNTEVPDYPPIDSQQYFALHQMHAYPGRFYYVTTFETATRFQPGWAARQIEYLRKSFDSGAVGVKVWKNIGMTIKDRDSNFIMIDNPMFDTIFNYLIQHKVTVIGHCGEPKDCWLPFDQMITNNDKAYYKEHPEYHMYLHPNYPSYDAQIQARDHLLEEHPNLTFVGAHLGSLEWSVDEMAKRLNEFPNMAMDCAARVSDLEYLTIQNWQKVHDFFIKYQDRILYGTDLEEFESSNSDSIRLNTHAVWVRDWKYFTSDDTLESPDVNGKFKGLHLPKSVIDKLYYKNAEKWFLSKVKKNQ